VDSVIPALDGYLELSEDQMKFFLHAIRDLNPEALNAEAEVRRRVVDIRNKSYQIYPYPCIRAFLFLTLSVAENDAFFHVLKATQGAAQASAPLFLDIGCCMGTDLRYLVQSGYPSTSVIGCDIRGDFIDLGYELYGDRDTNQIPFFVGDIFDITLLPFPQAAAPEATRVLPKDVQSLNELRGRVKYIFAGLLFHLFDEGTQEAIARRLATLLDMTPGNGPAVIFGKHMCKAVESVIDDDMGRTRYAHSPESWVKLWERVLGDKVHVHVDAEFRPQSGEKIQLCDWKWNPGRSTELMWWSVWVD